MTDYRSLLERCRRVVQAHTVLRGGELVSCSVFSVARKDEQYSNLLVLLADLDAAIAAHAMDAHGAEIGAVTCERVPGVTG